MRHLSNQEEIVSRSILTQLKGFGLNPSDWLIKKNKPATGNILLEHREDRNFRFQAKVNLLAAGPGIYARLSQLRLISI